MHLSSSALFIKMYFSTFLVQTDNGMIMTENHRLMENDV